jgi:pantoate--beta-alanine ligase
MKTFQTVASVVEYLQECRAQGKRIGFVPTMGALHQGHLSLIAESKKSTDITVCSIFVNPLQFNNPEDFAKYPIVVDKDVALLAGMACDVLFQPSVKEMYPAPVTQQYDFGSLATVMEGAFRPGHFNGVGIVVKRLFDIIMPDMAFFGEKDYQQLLIIKRLVEMERLSIKIVPCAIVREPDGLAMSSRNLRLSAEKRTIAPRIYQILSTAVGLKAKLSPEKLKLWAMAEFDATDGLKLEYFELSDAQTLEAISVWIPGQEVIACVAVFAGEIRLIDNIRFIS